MKKMLVVSLMILLGAAMVVPAVLAQGPSGRAESRDTWWWCPWCGRALSDSGPGGLSHPGDRGHGRYGPGRHRMGPGHMGPERWRGYGASSVNKPLNKEEAVQLLERYVRNTENPNLKLGEVTEKEDNFVGNVVTKNGSLVDKIFVDKKTGWMKSAY